ncbi:hypothetical protein CXB51_002111 [Gossypium anomalum]|uniref:WD repeat-containing protein 13 n=1 Tax=Gossypium anomalum TaxID=47600 RepID=A0A8J6D840_9ROSI|nr:hypothetical protein CXB51_002111 [Gossypium anomalum]
MAEVTSMNNCSKDGGAIEAVTNNDCTINGTGKDIIKVTVKKANVKDPEIFSCLLQPASSDSDLDSIGVRRFLLARKAESGVHRRLDWRCNGKGYVAYRNYIRRPRNWENSQIPSYPSTPGNRVIYWLMHQWAMDVNFKFTLAFVRGGKLELKQGRYNICYDFRSGALASNHRTSFSSSISDSDRPRGQGVEPAYSFVGMHCIFDQCKSAVTVLKFGHMSSDLLAYGASDGTLTVCNVSDPPTVINQLKGHSKDVTDFDFSSNNQYIASSSADKTVRVWELSKGLCIRVIYGVSPQLCIRFHPVNNNFLSVGNANKEITVFNFSTGRVIAKSIFDSEVTSMDHDHTGHLIFCGDAQGCIYSVTMDSRTGALSRSHRYRSSSKQKFPITTVQYRSFSLLAGGPVLLTCTKDGSLSFFSIALEVQVAGSEDSNVYFYDLTRPKHTCVNKLQGHRFPVLVVAWNHGENFLASADLYGVVIVWKRAKTS